MPLDSESGGKLNAWARPANPRRVPYGPSPPLAVHDRGSHGASGSTVDVVVVGAVVVVVPPPAPVVPDGVTVAGGGLTLNWVPVTTVTCDPDWTCVGSMAMSTAPLIEFATAWAAARLACVFDE